MLESAAADMLLSSLKIGIPPQLCKNVFILCRGDQDTYQFAENYFQNMP